jgi:integrase
MKEKNFIMLKSAETIQYQMIFLRKWIKIVSEPLGHASIKITQEYYGKVVQKRLSEEMNRISRQLQPLGNGWV